MTKNIAFDRLYASRLPSVSVVTFAGPGEAEPLGALLRSLRRLGRKDCETLVADADSSGQVAACLAEEFPGALRLPAPEGQGFAEACNAALAYARGDFFLILRNDVLLTPNFLEPLLWRARRRRVAAVSPKAERFYCPSELAFAGPGGAASSGQVDEGQHDAPCQVRHAYDGALLVSREACERVGLMDARMDGASAVADWSERFARAGGEVWYEPVSLALDKRLGEGSTPQEAFASARGQLLFWRRNASGAALAKGVAGCALRLAGKATIRALSGRAEEARAVMAGLAWHLRPQERVFDSPSLLLDGKGEPLALAERAAC